MGGGASLSNVDPIDVATAVNGLVPETTLGTPPPHMVSGESSGRSGGRLGRLGHVRSGDRVEDVHDGGDNAERAHHSDVDHRLPWVSCSYLPLVSRTGV